MASQERDEGDDRGVEEVKEGEAPQPRSCAPCLEEDDGSSQDEGHEGAGYVVTAYKVVAYIVTAYVDMPCAGRRRFGLRCYILESVRKFVLRSVILGTSVLGI